MVGWSGGGGLRGLEKYMSIGGGSKKEGCPLPFKSVKCRVLH